MSINDLNKKITEPHILDTIDQKKSTTQELIKNLNIHENYEHSKLTEHETKQIIEQLEQIDLEKDRHSKGSEGVIFKIHIMDEHGQSKEYVAAKKRYDNNPDNEWKIHKKVEDIVNTTMPDSIVKVPELKAVITLNSMERFIIMEFVNGKTLYQMELEEIFKRRNIPTGEFQSDMEAEGVFSKMLNLDPMSQKDAEQIQKKYYQEMKWIKLFTPEQGKKYKEELKKFLQEIHKEGVYHRDGSNPRNIMITPEGEIYVIDFGKSTWREKGDRDEKNIYETQEGEKMIGIYPRDEEIIAEIAGLTKDEEDMEMEAYKEEQKQKNKMIQSDRSVFEYLKEIPTAWMKNQNKTATMKEKIERQSRLSKKISLYQLEETKTKEELIILILAQSKANIDEVLLQINNRKKTLENEIKTERTKQQQTPRHLLQTNDKKGIEDYRLHYEKKIQKIQKKLDRVNDIENFMIYLKTRMQ